MQWHPVLTGSGSVAVVVGTLFAAALVAGSSQLDAVYTAGSDVPDGGVPELLGRVKAIDSERLLIAIGEALSPFAD